MRNGRLRTLALLAALGLAAGCGEILDEVDKANDLAGKPTGMRVGPAPVPEKSEPEEASPGVVAQLQGWVEQQLGTKPPEKPGRDPDDRLVSCRVAGTTSYMLRSACLSRAGTVVADKGKPR